MLGGTFDPPHMAHLVLAEAAYRQLGVVSVEFVPAGVPWWKSSRAPTAGHHRLAMTRLATIGTSYFEVNDCELKREGPSYMIDTLEALPTSDEVFLVLGADAAQGIRSWMRWGEVVDRARLAVAFRPGANVQAVERAIGRAPLWLDVPRLDISSGQIRRFHRAGRSIHFLVPEAVHSYIHENRLYAPGGGL